MSRVTSHMSISVDGFVAGPDQSEENPLGIRGIELHQWHLGEDKMKDPIAKAMADHLLAPKGAYVMGRNMFGPIRGEGGGDWRPGGGGGVAGGAWGDTTPRPTRGFSCCPTTNGSRSRWKAARPSTSSRAGST